MNALRKLEAQLEAQLFALRVNCLSTEKEYLISKNGFWGIMSRVPQFFNKLFDITLSDEL